MPIIPAGFQWLKEHYNLTRHQLTHSSYIGNHASIEMTSKGNIEQVYGPRYNPANNTSLDHVEFGLKYDDLNLDFLQAVFKCLPKKEIKNFVQKSPTGKYSRKIGFLYELLTGTELTLDLSITANYIDLLVPGKYVTGTGIKNNKWKINNNLLGNEQFCPIVRKTQGLVNLLQVDIKEKVLQLQQSYPEDIFKRVARYLYNKETRSSYEIEKEQPSPDRMEKFVALLMKAGSEDPEKMLARQRLVNLQNAIVDPRFAANDFRDFQNYIGESLPNYQDMIHYICPPPAILPSLMDGLQATWLKTGQAAIVIRAALVAFGFVFIHPFEDGNGRLHRFLIHDLLVHGGLVPPGLVIPVSAHMLNNMKAYDNILEKYSKPLMQRVLYDKTGNGEIAISNPAEVESYYRYPDLTEQCIYLMETIHATIKEDMPGEITFLLRYDEAKKALQRIVDMPDKHINLMLIFLHQNQGIFPKRRREQFAKLTDEEILQMQQVYREIYELED
jgi:Fic family protein